MIQFECKSFKELSLEELYDCMVVRQAVFVVEQDCPYLDADGKDQQAWHLMGKDENNKVVAYTRLIPAGVSYEQYASIGRVVTAQSARGGGVGRQLMEESIRMMEQLFPKVAVKISAQCYLEQFYNSLGFETVGAEYLEDGIPHYPMILRDRRSDAIV